MLGNLLNGERPFVICLIESFFLLDVCWKGFYAHATLGAEAFDVTVESRPHQQLIWRSPPARPPRLSFVFNQCGILGAGCLIFNRYANETRPFWNFETLSRRYDAVPFDPTWWVLARLISCGCPMDPFNIFNSIHCIQLLIQFGHSNGQILQYLVTHRNQVKVKSKKKKKKKIG